MVVASGFETGQFIMALRQVKPIQFVDHTHIPVLNIEPDESLEPDRQVEMQPRAGAASSVALMCCSPRIVSA